MISQITASTEYIYITVWKGDSCFGVARSNVFLFFRVTLLYFFLVLGIRLSMLCFFSSFFSMSIISCTPSTTNCTSSTSPYPRRSALEMSNVPPTAAVSTPPITTIIPNYYISLKSKVISNIQNKYQRPDTWKTLQSIVPTPVPTIPNFNCNSPKNGKAHGIYY